MAFGLEELANQRAEEVEAALERARNAKSSEQAQTILLTALREIREGLANVTVSNLKDEISVNNLDEVRAALRNELGRISKPLVKALKDLNLTNERLEEIRSDVEQKNRVALEENFDLQIIRKPKQRISIDNISDIIVPEKVTVRNLDDLGKYFEDLQTTIQSTFSIDVPTPQVTVNPPDVVVPEIKVPEVRVPESSVTVNTDLEPLIDIMKKVRDTIRKSAAKQDKQLMAVSGNGLNDNTLRKALKGANRLSSIVSGSKELTSAGTAVQLSATSVPCQYVDIGTTGGLASVGSSATLSDATSDAESGIILYPGNLPYRVSVDNLNKIWVAGATGVRLVYAYYV
jgi:hypothetical protein